MDLSNLDVRKASNEGATLELEHPTEGFILREPVPENAPEGTQGEALTITLAGTDSDVYRDALKARARQRLNQQKKKKNKEEQVDFDEAERKGIELLARCTMGWNHISDNGKPVPFNTNNAITIYTKYPWIKEQVDTFMADRSNFLKG